LVGDDAMSDRGSSARNGRHSARDRTTYHRRGSKTVLITRERAATLTAFPELAHWVTVNNVLPSVMCRCHKKDRVDEGEQLLAEPAEVFSHVRRPVRHTDSRTGVSLHTQQTEEGAFAVWGESSPEVHTSVLLSQQYAVLTHVTQFARLLWGTPWGYVEHYPDVLVEMRNGERVILDVRPRDGWSASFLAKAYMTWHWARGLGIRYGLVDSPEVASILVRVAARPYRDAGDPIAAAASTLWHAGINRPGAFVEDLARSSALELPLAKAAILSLVAQGLADVTVWNRFDHSSQVHCLHPTDDTLHDINITWGEQLRMIGAQE